MVAKMTSASRPVVKKNTRTVTSNSSRVQSASRVNALTRTSSLTNVPGASIGRQTSENLTTAKSIKKKVNEVLSLKGVPGTMRFEDRLGMQDFLARAVESGIDTLIIPDEQRLARNLMVQEEALSYLKKLGLKLLHSKIPQLFMSQDPLMIFLRQILGAFSQLENSIRVSTLADGRRRAKKTTSRRTVTKKKKVEGRDNFLEIHPELPSALRGLLKKPFARRMPKSGSKRPLRLDDVSTYLADQWGIVTQNRKSVKTGKPLKGGKHLQRACVYRWLKACDKL